VKLADLLDQLVTSQAEVASPEITTRHDQYGYLGRRLDDAPERLIRVQTDDQVVIVRHRRCIKFGPGWHSLQRPAARIYYLPLEAEALAEGPGQHALAARYVRDVPRLREAIGYETRGDIEAGRISVKTVPGHHAPINASPPARSWARWCGCGPYAATAACYTAPGTRCLPRGARALRPEERGRPGREPRARASARV